MNNNTKARWKRLKKKDRQLMAKAKRISSKPKVGNPTQKRQVERDNL